MPHNVVIRVARGVIDRWPENESGGGCHAFRHSPPGSARHTKGVLVVYKESQYRFPFLLSQRPLAEAAKAQVERVADGEKQALADYKAELRRIGVTWMERIPENDPRFAEREAAHARYEHAMSAAIKSLPTGDPWEKVLSEIDAAILASKNRAVDQPYDTSAIESFDAQIARLCTISCWELPPPYPIEHTNTLAMIRRRDWLVRAIEGHQKEAVEVALHERSATSQLPTKQKRSTVRGQGHELLVSTLLKHHQYAEDGSCLNLEPIGNNELARKAGVAASTASEFFNVKFNGGQKKGHTRYRVICRDSRQLSHSLKALSGDLIPFELYGRRPPGEGDQYDDE